MLQRGMQFRTPPAHGIILMSVRPGAPYADSANADGTIWYEGHDVPRSVEHPNPKVVDQPRTTRAGRLTENGKFAESVEKYREGLAPPARFHVYEKVRDGIWVFRGAYLLTDYRFERSAREGRKVFRFFLEPALEIQQASWMPERSGDVEFERRIPGWVQALVYKRDRGRCVKCGETRNLHFDHILPFSKGGSSSAPENIQLLCARHNLEKGARFGD